MTKPELAAWNTAIVDGRARHSGGTPLVEALESGLVTSDGSSAYAIRDGVPALLPTLRIISQDWPAGPAAEIPRAASYQTYDDSWEEISHHWPRLAPPLRPSRQDIDALQRVVADGSASKSGSPLRALLLGVTPEVATMRWPAGTRLLALDAIPGMIRNVWPAREAPHAVAALADWVIMPVRDAAYDLAVGDAIFTTVPYPDGFLAVVAELRRVLRDDGTFVVREFARPEAREPLDTIFRDLREGRTPSFAFFIWRLAMAVHGDLGPGLHLGDVCDAWHENVPDPDELMRSLGWPIETPRLLEVMREAGKPSRFPTLNEMREVFAADFDQVEVHVPDYQDGARYPTVVFKPKRHSCTASGA